MSIPFAGLSALLVTLSLDGGVPVASSKAGVFEAIPVEGLTDAVRIELDELGTPSIEADDRNDAFAALGFAVAKSSWALRYHAGRSLSTAGSRSP